MCVLLTFDMTTMMLMIIIFHGRIHLRWSPRLHHAQSARRARITDHALEVRSATQPAVIVADTTYFPNS